MRSENVYEATNLRTNLPFGSYRLCSCDDGTEFMKIDLISGYCGFYMGLEQYSRGDTQIHTIADYPAQDPPEEALLHLALSPNHHTYTHTDWFFMFLATMYEV